MERASYSLRFAATIVDCVVVIIAVCLISAVSDTERVVQVIDTFESDSGSLGFARFDTRIWSLVVMLYSSMEIFRSATLGKRVFRLCILRENGGAGSFLHLAARWCVRRSGAIIGTIGWLVPTQLLVILSVVLVVIVAAGSALALRQRRSALHDLITKTAVYRLPYVS